MNLIQLAATKLFESQKIKVKMIATKHFEERVLQRFLDSDFDRLERAIEKAFLAAKPGEEIRYTHPAYDMTVVGQKMGLNGFELITCWKGVE